MMIEFEQLKNLVLQELRDGQDCHTILLYGSWSRGEATPTSDVDVFGVRKDGEPYRVGRHWQNTILDAWIYPESALPQPESLLHLRESVVILDGNGLAAQLKKDIASAFALPLPDLRDWDVEFRITWIKKMLKRSQQGDVEGHFRLHWLLYDLLETWHLFARQRYLGPKESLKLLKLNEPEVYRLFKAAFKPGAEISAIEDLSTVVISKANANRTKI